MNKDQFYEICKTRFDPIIKKYNFRIVKQVDEDWGYKLFMQNETTGIEMYFEFRDMMVLLKLYRLIDGTIQEAKGEIRPDTVLNSFNINDLLEIRSPESKVPSQETIDGLDNIIKKMVAGKKVKLDEYPEEIQNGGLSIDNVLSKHLKNLEEYAADILKGDFAIFKEIDIIVKKRAREIAFNKWGNDATKFGWTV
jgi:hypothetical protein